jgi:CheY-like chemotaxis protein
MSEQYLFEKIMAIDDSFTDRLITEKMTRKFFFAHSVISFNFAPDALEYLRSMSITHHDWPKLIFLDICMPTMDGFQFLDAYEKIPGASLRKSVVVLSSTQNSSDLQRVDRYSSVLSFIEKPLNKEKLDKLTNTVQAVK